MEVLEILERLMSFPHVAELRDRKFGYFQRSKEEMGELPSPQ